VTVLLTTAYMDEAERCHRISLMHDGMVIAAGSPDELTAGLAGRVFAVQTLHPDDVLDALRTAPAAQSATIAGPEVRVLTRDGGSDLAERLAAAGLAEVTLDPAPPRLEDVFIEHDGRAAGRGLKPAEHLDQGGLAGAVGAEQPQDLARVDRHAHRVDRREGVEPARQSIREDGRPPTGGPGGARWLRRRRGQPCARCRAEERAVPRYGIPRAQRAGRIEALLSSLGLEALADRRPLALPLGLRQRLALACAVLHEPRVVFLDEPTAGVDPLARRQFWDLVHLLAHQRGVAVLVSTHYMDEAMHCDRLGFMHEGRLVGLGSPAGLKRQAAEEGGPMIAVEALDFARAFVLLQEHFPHAMLYGRRIRWQSAEPRRDIARARDVLAAAAVPAVIDTQPLSMEDTFVSVLRAAGLGHG
jgi:drug efflux transport system ATP-binding protein